MEGATYKTDSLTLVRKPFDREGDRGKHDLGPTTDQCLARLVESVVEECGNFALKVWTICHSLLMKCFSQVFVLQA